MEIIKGILLVIFMLTLGYGALMDYKYKEVYVIVFWICDFFAIFMLTIFMLSEWNRKEGIYYKQVIVIADLLIFIILQKYLFSRMYGQADVRAFISCGIVLASFGFGIMENLLFMGLVFILLTVVSLLKKNINSHGNLKVPVALIPYIWTGFAIFMIACLCRCAIKYRPLIVRFLV